MKNKKNENLSSWVMGFLTAAIIFILSFMSFGIGCILLYIWSN